MLFKISFYYITSTAKPPLWWTNTHARFLTNVNFTIKPLHILKLFGGSLWMKKDSDLKVCSASPPHLTRKKEREHHSLLYQNPFDCMLSIGGKVQWNVHWSPCGTNWSLCGTSGPSLTNCWAASLPSFFPKARGMHTSNMPCSRSVKTGLELSTVLHPAASQGEKWGSWKAL